MQIKYRYICSFCGYTTLKESNNYNVPCERCWEQLDYYRDMVLIKKEMI